MTHLTLSQADLYNTVIRKEMAKKPRNVMLAHSHHTGFSLQKRSLVRPQKVDKNASFTPSVQPVASRQTTQPNGRGRNFMTTLQGLLRGRATKNINLLLLLATTGTLYFVTYPANRHTPSIPASIPLARQRKQGLLSGAGDPAWHTWHMLNPREDPLSITRPQQLHRGRPAFSYSWVVRTTARMTRIVVLPIATTVAALYALPLYLLKDAERLEAQRHRADTDSLPLQSADPPTAPLAFSVLPRAHSTDIELLAVSAEERTAAGVSLENELILWARSVAPIALGAADVLSAGPSNLSAAITALALDDNGSLCAAGTGAGVVAIWALSTPTVGRPRRVLRGASSAVTGVHVVNTHVSGVSTPFSPTRPDHMPTVVTVLCIPDTDRLVAAFFIEDGSLDIVELVTGLEPPLAAVCRLQACNPTDTFARFHACLVELDGMGTLVIGAATEAGVISLWDGTTSSCISSENPIAALSALCPELSSPSRSPPHLLFSFTEYFSPGHHFFNRLFVSTLHMRSQFTTTTRGATMGFPARLHSRNSSTASTTPVQPSRSRHASMSEDNTSFPISGQGVLSRRASEKDSLRRAAASDTLAVPESKLDGPLGPTEAPHIPARWRSLVVGRVVDTMCERGAWDVTGSRVVGLRRRSRRLPDSDASKAADAVPRTQRDCGLSAASLERWEAWTFDPAEGRISASPLAALQPIASAFSARSAVVREMPRLPFTRVGPLVSGRTCCLAGFGNTVGLLAPADMVKEGD
ncbi:hypothetical protein EDB83DRAFT_2551938 [Lactarius deliciosus]|nr:hypothetical protein EDB83DRAFT_2551938 [Lactarius deliciosus]